jgi:hypothetical protein
VELDKLHIFQAKTAAQHQTLAITRIDIGIGTRLEQLCITAGCQNDRFCMEKMYPAIADVPGRYPETYPVFNQQRKQIKFIVKPDRMPAALFPQCREYGMTGSISRMACPCNRPFSPVTGMTAE